MVDDVVRALGYATLGSRLKRIGERLQVQTLDLARTLAEEAAAVDLPVPYNPVLAALDRNGPLSIGEIAQALGQSQPGVTRMVNGMKAAGLVAARPAEDDRRISSIYLTPKGLALVAQLKRTLWPAAALAVEDACAGLEGSFLDQLAQLEDALSKTPLAQRLPDRPAPDWDAFVSRKDQEKEEK